MSLSHGLTILETFTLHNMVMEFKLDWLILNILERP